MFKKLVDKFFKKTVISENEKLYDHLATKGCVDCGSTEFFEGPCGGCAQNIKCVQCGSKYNIMPVGWAERLVP